LEAWFQLLGEEIGKQDIQPDCIYGSDETGFELGSHSSKRVVEPKARHIQYNVIREN
jgi:hypothetical protein